MKAAYPVILKPTSSGYVVYVPELDLNTQGTDIPNAIEMARDAIGLWGICEQDMGRSIPRPSGRWPEHAADEIVTLVDIDFDEYRRLHDTRAVRKNVTIPGWLNERAERAGVNFSQILQEGLKKHLGLESYSSGPSAKEQP